MKYIYFIKVIKLKHKKIFFPPTIKQYLILKKHKLDLKFCLQAFVLEPAKLMSPAVHLHITRIPYMKPTDLFLKCYQFSKD